MQICIINTGSANLNSVQQALNRLGVKNEISSDVKVLEQADKLIMPGVGSADSIMRGMKEFALTDFVKGTKKPLLGICLGLQIEGAASEEVPLGSPLTEIPMLGLVKGRVKKLPSDGQRLPHMGWNTVGHTGHPLFDGIKQNAYFYFDHSFALELGDYTIGSCEYGVKFTAALGSGNFMGVQFHPEKSGAAGEQLLRNFISNF